METNKGKIYSQMLQVQKSLKPFKKTAEGYGYNYVELSDILAELIPAMNAAGLVLIQQPFQYDEKTLEITNTIANSDGDSLVFVTRFPIPESPKTDKGKDKLNAIQLVGSACTYGRRYSLTSIFGLAEMDDDASDHKDIPKNKAMEKPSQKTEPVENWLAKIAGFVSSSKTLTNTEKAEIMKTANSFVQNPNALKEIYNNLISPKNDISLKQAEDIF